MTFHEEMSDNRGVSLHLAPKSVEFRKSVASFPGRFFFLLRYGRENSKELLSLFLDER